MPSDSKQYARERAAARSQSVWFKLKEGENSFRILPTPSTKKHPYQFFEYSIHRDVGPKKAIVRCGIDPVSEKGECWLCDEKIPALRKSGNDTRATALAAKPNFLVQVAKVDVETTKMTGPFLFTPAKQVADQILTSVFGSRKKDFTDPVKGINIFINRTGTGKNDTRYSMLEPDEEPSRVPKSIIEKLLPFDELKEVPKYSAAKQKAAYAGRDVVEEDEEEAAEEEETPKHKKKPVDEEDEDIDGAADEEDEEEMPAPKKKDKKKPVEEDEDEEVEEETEEDEEEEEEPPTPVKKKKKKPEPEPEDEEEPEEEEEEADEEDEEEPPPVKKKKKKPVVEEEEEDEEEEEEPETDVDEDEDEPAPVKKKKAAAPAKKKKPTSAEDEEEEVDLNDIPDDEADLDEADEEEEEPTPKKKTPTSKKSAKNVVKKSARR